MKKQKRKFTKKSDGKISRDELLFEEEDFEDRATEKAYKKWDSYQRRIPI